MSHYKTSDTLNFCYKLPEHELNKTTQNAHLPGTDIKIQTISYAGTEVMGLNFIKSTI